LSATLTLQVDSKQQLNWALSQTTVTSLSLQCEIQNVSHIWLEAETLPLPPGWHADTAFVSGWNGSGFLYDNYSSEQITYEFEASTARQIYVWTRILKRVSDNSPLQLKVNGQVETVSQAIDNTINQWIWERSGPFAISAGKNILTIARPYVDKPSEFMGIFLDTLIITSDANLQPEQNHYLPLPAQHFRFASEQSQGQLTPNLKPGIYQCYASVDGKHNLVDNYGHEPVKSNVVLIEIKP